MAHKIVVLITVIECLVCLSSHHLCCEREMSFLVSLSTLSNQDGEPCKEAVLSCILVFTMSVHPKHFEWWIRLEKLQILSNLSF